MGRMTFRKSIKLPGGARINVSSKGIGASVGVRGLRVTQRADGRTTMTTSIPGTGLSRTDTLRGAGRSSTTSGQTVLPPVVAGRPNYWLGFILTIILPPFGMILLRAWGFAALWFVATLLAISTGRPISLIVGALFHYRSVAAQKYPV